MPLSAEKVDELLQADDLPNESVQIAGASAALSIPKNKVPVDSIEARRRRETVGEMMIQGYSFDQICDFMRVKYKDRFGHPVTFDENKTRSLMRSVRSHWDAEDAENEAYSKTTAIRRHLSHIRKAEKQNKWNAVAMLEKNLAQIQGNLEEPDASQLNGNLIGDAVNAVLGNMAPERLRELIDEEAQRAKLAIPIDVPGEEVKTKP